MTRFEYIKSLNEKELAQYLCETLQIAEVECENCPAFKFCYKGHNGMKSWLMRDAEEKTADKD